MPFSLLPLAVLAVAAAAALAQEESYPQCKLPEESVPLDVIRPCLDCANPKFPCPDGCCGSYTTDASVEGDGAQRLACNIGGCCMRTLNVPTSFGGDNIFVSESLRATSAGEGNACAGIVADESCGRCAYRPTVLQGSEDCKDSGIAVPEKSVKVGKILCADGVTEVKAERQTPANEPESDAQKKATNAPVAKGAPSPKNSPEPKDTKESSANDDKDDEKVCFPSSATVELESGRVKRMDELAVGDRVQVAPGVFSDVFGFTHRLAGGIREFVRIDVGGGGEVLVATAGHYVYLNGELRAAREAKIGDLMTLGSGGEGVVGKVSVVMAHGLYNPQTLHGDIVVGGVVASTYTRAVDARVAHAGLMLARAAFNWFGASTSAFESGSELTGMLPGGPVVVG